MPLFSTPFDASSTTHDVLANVDLSGRRAIVTGATSGLGTETARALAQAGAEVTMAVRNEEAGRETATRIRQETGGTVEVSPVDLADQTSVTAFVRAWEGPLHILVNNAGIMAAPEQYTPEGWELHFATNHLGHFALANGLHDALAAARGARVVSVTSALHLASPMVFDDINFTFRPYYPFMAYAQSKTANVLFTVAAARRWAADGITVNAAMPGYILTNLQQHLSDEAMVGMTRFRVSDPVPAEQGAATTVMLAGSPLLNGVSGRYFEDCNEAPVVHDSSGWITGVAPWALDPANAERLWEMSGAMLAAAAR
ncbi:SDR family NAD(P)-dependent oxidoreductase [Streptomyces sp. NPDC101225]|uniref:SDR family NAD(P)-dependent oxidoreductase n=1 Tax=Streptomyces sp. NPDC101225 TaxID=3366135 RepID=UPI0038081C73